MTDEEQAIIDFAVLWLPYGGPPDEEILVRFGMSEQRFRARLADIVADRGTSVDRAWRQRAAVLLQSYLGGAPQLDLSRTRPRPRDGADGPATGYPAART
ncbi:hypothetical protein C8258_00155 [Nocardia sp. MDA0666]|uniref:DUF3263 domain-containing protein n=1 Tax=Nocardia sp. MDA0666 TaxID=2135448 RepID=UPI000D1210BF|nr:DUF3263 domain-containing protein [Nocardia sp. MDA0666]PSR69563.1 hypothetical protein C8258_00155 [Nocardia sp. MDA0666]